MIYKNVDIESLKQIAIELSSKIKPGDTILLTGEVGAGKTTFAKFFASALGIKDTVSSPTFNILKEYKTDNLVFVHMDAYRLENSEYYGEFDDYIFDDKRIMLIEWPQFLDVQIKNPIKVNIIKTGDNREVQITC